MNNLETLSGGDITKWKSIKAMSRSDVYVKLFINRDKNIFDKNLREIIARKNKAST